MNGANPMGIPVITGNPFGGTCPSVKDIQTENGSSFGDVLSKRLAERWQDQPITFSKHAQSRTGQRGIELSQNDVEKLGGAMERAKAKGLTDTLVYMNNMAFIVNVPGKVVVTVMNSQETDGNVFTNIDGAVIL